MNAIAIDTITFKLDRMICIVRVAENAPASMTPALAEAVRDAVPRLPRHTCVNKHGTTLGDCLSSTSLPHVLEHLVIDRQVSYDEGKYVGTTEWLDQSARTAKIEVSYHDDLVALRALDQAVCQLNDLLATALEAETGTSEA